MKHPAGKIDAEGNVFISVVITAEGKVTAAKVLKGIHPLYDAEAIRVVSGMPDWTPAKENNKPIATKMVIPVKFTLTNN